MKLWELKHGPGHAWPPMFGGSYLPGWRFPTGEEGVLSVVENAKGMPGLHLEIEYEGHTFSGIMQWDGDPSPDQVRNILRNYIGKDLRELRDIEVPTGG